MNKKIKFASLVVFSSLTILAACSEEAATETEITNSTEQVEQTEQAEQTAQAETETQLTKGQEMMNLLGSTNWQGTKVYDKDNNDLTKENANFIGLAKYDAETGRYEFFDAATKETRGDEGIFFMTNDGEKRVLISNTMKYQAVVEMTELNEDIFTYRRMGKDAAGKDVEIFVEHIPYDETELAFTNQMQNLTATTGTIITDVDGDEILGETLWQGTKVLDGQGIDVTEQNSNFISIAKYDPTTNKYEFFNVETGVSRGDFGYFDVINSNKIRAHVSLGENKYGAALELTELNDSKFTYKRMGKDKAGNEATIFVEHEPYNGELSLNFSF
ncbi:DUF4822 domain-containing protein [Solibacillus sp. R5-41]|uniref:DUF4822 domain-containing protein n=1 Tax=Solibacillus sp. R5-41 TaxID=2048654 RepID=UPI000C129934|nr:DUF4822 domain-containing protein [Solibacillus sp. R5-41]ATP39831.1 DUF4822 domain-containing protein [Solibacillus sp. R5-41]